jgi:large subunit ribosomal protein L21
MFAVIETGGRQYKVTPGLALNVDRLPDAEGSTVQFERVLMVGDEGNVTVGNPIVANAKVTAHVIEHGRDEKIIVFRYKAKSNYRRRTGHRQPHTKVRITEILPG